MFFNLIKLIKIIKKTDGLYKSNEPAYLTVIRAIYYCVVGGYVQRINSESHKYVSLRQLDREKMSLMRSVPDISYEHIQNLHFSVWLRIKLFTVILFFSLFSVFSKKISLAMLSLVFYYKLTADNQPKTFIYYSFLTEVYSTLKLCKMNSKPLNYFELANFLDDKIRIETNKLNIIYELTENFFMNSNKIRFDSIHHYVSKNEIIRRSKNHKNENKIVGFYASGYYARLKHNSHDDAFLRTSEYNEAIIISKLANIANEEGWEFLICPHYTRDVENIEDAKNYYREVIGNKFDINKVMSQTTVDPCELNLTLTYGSNVFFDAYGMGKKSLIIEGPEVYRETTNSIDVQSFILGINEISSGIIGNAIIQSDETFYKSRG